MRLPLITLGIPIYNAAELIEQTLLSALGQTYKNIEYIFVDDKGNSMDIVNRIVASHPRGGSVRIISHEHNQGIGAARNTAFKHATGEYFFTMDCDDIIIPECIELLYQKMQEYPVNFVAASFIRADLDGNKYPGCQYQDTLIEGGEFSVAEYRYGQGKQIFVATWNKLYATEFLRKNDITCKAGHYNEDPWFTYQVILNASSCRLLSDCTLYYTYNPQSVSGLSAARGYSEKIARQYVDIQKLKSEYIRCLTGKSFYRNLLTDIMEMSLYHAYRIGVSPILPAELKKELQLELLTRTFASPDRKNHNRYSFKYILLCTFFALPISIKEGLVWLGVNLRVKDRLRRWIHFNN